ncbi:MAG: sigma-70 family RNA polymerase sigma factor [Deltaproteobacteria bacterium]|nr:sigma-70 family RNA polymerase sigma factor [Deltaproteobacteria bacterium]
MGDDHALLESWRRGDARAGAALLERHSAMVTRFFQSKLGDDIDDIVQQTFADVVRARDTVSSTGFRAYLLAVARHRLVDQLRRKSSRPEAFDIASVSVQDLRTSLSERLARDERRAVIVAALRSLSLEFQMVLELTYWEDLSGAEIAVVLGVSPHTVRSRLSRARAALRSALRPGEITNLSITPAALARDLSTPDP